MEEAFKFIPREQIVITRTEDYAKSEVRTQLQLQNSKTTLSSVRSEAKHSGLICIFKLRFQTQLTFRSASARLFKPGALLRPDCDSVVVRF